MSNSGSFRRKLNAKNVWIAEEVRRKKLEIAKQFVEEKVKTDPEFAQDVLTALGENLSPEIKKTAEATIAKQKMNLTPCVPDGGCSAVDVPQQELLDALEKLSLNQQAQLEKHGLIPEGSKVVVERRNEPSKPLREILEKECCGHQCGCHSDDGMVQVQSDGGGIHLVHETELPDYPQDQ